MVEEHYGSLEEIGLKHLVIKQTCIESTCLRYFDSLVTLIKHLEYNITVDLHNHSKSS